MNAPPRRLGVLERPDCRIHYEVTGEGPAIVFAHGLGGNHLSWFQQVAHFAPRYTCVTFAHRGFHPSSPLADGPDPQDYAGDLATLIEHLKLDDVRIVAQSMGGWSALEYALTKPPALKALVMACTTGTIDPLKIGEPERTRLNAWLQSEAPRAPALFGRGIHPAAGERMAHEQPAMHLLYRHISDQNAALDVMKVGARLFAMRTRAPEDLRAVACPILFVSGDEDVVIPPFAADAIARVVPRTKVAHIPNAGHSTYFERPARFNAIVEEFFAQL
ncbi:MAG: alpha/beta hydrolase [Alphaproteobacteria bacterium]|jgi:3-oxoadipate enol-lactonase|nr:alpha/beta hydrolase [Alphaproteobacteria bacterium]